MHAPATDHVALVEGLPTGHHPVTARAVVTGVGAVTPLGVGADSLVSRWTRGECGLADGLGRCDDFDPADFLSKREQRQADRFTQLAQAAAGEALEQAGWTETPYDPQRVGCVMGTGIGGIETIGTNHDVMRDSGSDRVPPLLIPRMMPNAAAAALAIRYGLGGEVLGVVSACAAGAHAIGTGLRILATGEADAVLVGGSESALCPLPRAGFDMMGATSRCGISRPFDHRRDGFVLGEGAAVLVLEAPAGAARRGAPVVGEVLGYAATSDAFHLTAPSPDGAAQARAMTQAMANARVGPDDIDYINAHGTSTPLNDRIETVAIKQALGDSAYAVPISSTKSVVGHMLGAAGAVDLVATLGALSLRTAPPTVGCEEPDEDLDLNYVQGTAQPMLGPEDRPQLVGVSNAFGFGGHNAVLVVRV